MLNHKYQIGGFTPENLVRKYGSPVYVYDTAVIKNKYEALQAAFKSVPKVRINFACKSLTNISILKYVRKLGSCLDTVSIQEIQLAIHAGFAPQQIGFTPSGVTWQEIQEAVSLGVKIHLDSIPLLEKFGIAYGSSYPIGIRINPHIMAGGNLKISTGHKNSKFGISILQMKEVLSVAAKTGLIIEGLHQHTGSEIKDAETFAEVCEAILHAAKDFKDLTYIDLGGGFKVAYKKGDIATDLTKVGELVGELFNNFCKSYGRSLELVWEPGKYLVAESGYFLTTVNVVKHNPEISFAGLDTGLNHLIRPMFYDAYHEIINTSNQDGEKFTYNVVGYICETDTFAADRLLPELREGDIVCFENAGAYCYTMSSNYNSRFRPPEVLIYEGKDYMIRERESIEDILNKQIMIDF
jgi:diaminopimelate decarboxylase